MDELLQHVNSTLSEEIGIIDGAIALAEETRQALQERSLHKLNVLGIRQQNSLVQLQIVRQSKEHLLKSLRKSTPLPATKRRAGLRYILQTIGAEEELRRLEELDERLRTLQKKNRVNDLLLNKQYSSFMAYQHLLDLAKGVDRVYGRDGSVQTLKNVSRVEQTL